MDWDPDPPTPTEQAGPIASPSATTTATPTATLISEIIDPIFVVPTPPTDVSSVLGVVAETQTPSSDALQLPGAGGGSGGGPPRIALTAALLGLSGLLLALAGYRRARQRT